MKPAAVDKVKRLPGTEGKPRIVQVVELGEPPVESKKGKDSYCRHRHVTLVDAEHRVICRDCEEYIDPYLALENFANDWTFYKQRYRDASLIVKGLEETVAELKRQEKNTRARMRKLEPEKVRKARTALIAGDRAIRRVQEALRSLKLDPESQTWRLLWNTASELRELAASLDPEGRRIL